MNSTVPIRYRQLRTAAPFESVSLGYHSIRLTPPGELEGAQQGYEGPTWEADWVVIGHDEICGDPIFIDASDDDFPVYTAAHGEGDWRPQLIAFSFQHLLDILAQLRSFRSGRTTPVDLERRPITADERDQLLRFIRERNPDVDMSFWEDWLRGDD